MNTPELQLAGSLAGFPVSRLHGPGQRWVLWVQGCSLRCTEKCLNPQLLPRAGGVRVTVGEVLAELRRARRRQAGIEGVTLVGGEPFDQAPVLALLARNVQAMELSVVTYTGWVLETLMRRGPRGSRELLAASDLLIDGPFLPHRYSPHLRWRSSDNQRLVLLSGRYSRHDLESATTIQGIDVGFDGEQLRLSGAQDRPMVRNILRRLRTAGFDVAPAGASEAT